MAIVKLVTSLNGNANPQRGLPGGRLAGLDLNKQQTL
jgi:hypothetical protein